MSGSEGGDGGKGGEVVATVPVSYGDVFNFNIGQGGQNGTDAGDDPATAGRGGGGGASDSNPSAYGGGAGAPDGAIAGGGGGGGAATVVSRNSLALLVAGGGGGGGGGGSYVEYRGGDGGNGVRFDLQSQPGTVFFVGGGVSSYGNGNGYSGTGLGAGERGYAAEQGSDAGGHGETPTAFTGGGGGGGGGGGWAPDGGGTGGHAGGVGEGGGGGAGSGTGFVDDQVVTPTSFGISDVSSSGDRGANGQVVVTYTVPTLIPTTTYAVYSPNPAYDGMVTVVADVLADVLADTGVGAPTGDVWFRSGGNVVYCANGSPVQRLDAAGSTSCGLELTPGTYSISASYQSNDGKFVDSEATVNITVKPRTPTTLSLASSSSPSTFGAADTLTATVGWDGGLVRGVPAGTVSFSDGSNVLCVDAPVESMSAVATCPVSLGVGTHHVTATYSGDSTDGFLGSTAALDDVVSAAPTSVAVTSNSGNPVTGGDAPTFTASVSSNGTTSSALSGTVQFNLDGTPLGSPTALANGSATSVAATGLTAGTHTVTATYSGDGDFAAATSAGLLVTVNPAADPGSGGSGNGGNGGSGGNGGNGQSGTPDLGITVSHVGVFRRLLPASYRLEVSNTGTAPTVGAIRAEITLPQGEIYRGVVGSGWHCKARGRTVTCTIRRGLAPNEHADATLRVDVTAKANTMLHTSATVTPSDSHDSNNTASDDVTVSNCCGLRSWFCWWMFAYRH